MKLLRFRKLFAIIALTVMVLMVLATGVSAAEESEYTDLGNAIDYLDEYTYHKNNDPNFEQNSAIAIETAKGRTSLFSTWWSLLPPLIAIGLALITKEVYSSLFVGILAGGLLAANFKPSATVDNVVNDGIVKAVSDTAGIFVFLVILGAIVSLINKAGGSRAFGRWAETHIHSKMGAAFATFILGLLIFIDDYFNCLTVGSVMRPVTDTHKISRAKLAYLIDATAAPVCMIAPISSWAAAVSKYAEGDDGFSLFIKAIPYNFYSLLTFVFIIAIIVMKFDFGPMKLHELNAEKGDLFTSGEVKKGDFADEGNPNGRVFDLLFPILVLIGSCIFSMIYVGYGALGDTSAGFIKAFSATDATVALPWGGLIALVITIIYYNIRRVVKFRACMDSIPEGFKAMVPAILILTMATALKNMTTLLGAKVFVGQLMEGAAAGLTYFLPAIIFLVACGLAFSTGTSWGTFGILIPIVTAIFSPESPLMIIGVSACLAGAVCGDHCSPISDTTIMSSAGAQCDHINHVSTQLPYALTVAGVSFVSFIFAGIIQNVYISLAIAVVLMIGTLFAIKFITQRAKTK